MFNSSISCLLWVSHYILDAAFLQLWCHCSPSLFRWRQNIYFIFYVIHCGKMHPELTLLLLDITNRFGSFDYLLKTFHCSGAKHYHLTALCRLWSLWRTWSSSFLLGLLHCNSEHAEGRSWQEKRKFHTYFWNSFLCPHSVVYPLKYSCEQHYLIYASSFLSSTIFCLGLFPFSKILTMPCRNKLSWMWGYIPVLILLSKTVG